MSLNVFFIIVLYIFKEQVKFILRVICDIYPNVGDCCRLRWRFKVL